MFCLKRRRDLLFNFINFFKKCIKNVPFLSTLIKKSLPSIIPFSERKKEIIPSSSVITKDVWVSQNIKIVIYKSVDVLKSGNESMYKALLK